MTFGKQKDRLRTNFPVANDATDFALLEDLEHTSMHNPLAPMFWDRAENYIVYNRCGEKWIDFTSAVAVANAGHSNRKILRAINDAVNHKVLTTFTFPHKYRLLLSQKVCNLFYKTYGHKYKCQFLCSGSEAIECAIDLAQSYKKKKRSIIVSFFNAFHGNTAKSDLLSGVSEFSTIKQGDTELIFLKVPYISRQSKNKPQFKTILESALSKYNAQPEDIIAVLLEPYQGRGVYVLDKDYAKQINQYCKSNNTLLIVDEIQSGVFRSGKFLASQYFEIDPDIFCLGKGLSSSLPISGVVAKKKIFDETKSLEVLTTHSSNPISCAASIANIDFLTNLSFQKKLKKRVDVFSKEIKNLSTYSKKIGYMESFGLAGCIHIENNKKPDKETATEIVKKSFENGLILNSPIGKYKSYIRMTPPLTITIDGIKNGFKILSNVLEAIKDQ